MRRTAASLVTAFLTLTGVALAQSGDAHVTVPAIYSSTPMTRNAHATFAAAVLATSSLDRGLNAMGLRRWPADSGRARLARGSKLALFDFPVVMYFSGINHELGHVTRADEKGFRSSFSIVGTPWSGNPFRLLGLDRRIFDDLGSQVGGVEASSRLKRLGEQSMLDVDRIPPGQALTTITSSLDLPLYALRNLSPDRFDLSLPRGGSPDGDAAQFVAILASHRAMTGNDDIDHVRRSVRARSTINFVDYGLWTLTYGVLRDHVWNGEGGVRVRWLQAGSLGLIPSMRYEWSPIGPQIYLGAHYRYARRFGTGYVRWSDGLGEERLVGFGLSMTDPRSQRIRPGAQLDVWTHGSHGSGIHGVISVIVPTWPSQRAALSVSIGAKSSGYLAAYPLRAGAYASAGLVVTAW